LLTKFTSGESCHHQLWLSKCLWNSPKWLYIEANTTIL
jgi:hypothetical protein